MNKVQKQRCIRLADYLEKNVKDDQYYHGSFKAIHNDGRVTYCAAGFAVLKTKMFPGLKLYFRADGRCDDVEAFTLQQYTGHAYYVAALENYFGAEAWEYVFSGWIHDMTRKSAIKNLRLIAA